MARHMPMRLPLQVVLAHPNMHSSYDGLSSAGAHKTTEPRLDSGHQGDESPARTRVIMTGSRRGLDGRDPPVSRGYAVSASFAEGVASRCHGRARRCARRAAPRCAPRRSPTTIVPSTFNAHVTARPLDRRRRLCSWRRVDQNVMGVAPPGPCGAEPPRRPPKTPVPRSGSRARSTLRLPAVGVRFTSPPRLSPGIAARVSSTRLG